jgi:hypothetical protein
MSALEEAFFRVGYRRQPVPPTQRTATAAAFPIPAREDRGPLKERLIEDKARIVAMTDDELEFEIIAVSENINAVRLELELHQNGEVERPADWKVRARRVLGLLMARLSLCDAERNRRQHIVAEQRRQAAREALEEKRAADEQERIAADARHAARMAAAEERKAANIEASRARERGLRDAFMHHARAMLPAETFAAIWAAVHAERDAVSEGDRI